MLIWSAFSVSAAVSEMPTFDYYPDQKALEAAWLGSGPKPGFYGTTREEAETLCKALAYRKDMPCIAGINAPDPTRIAVEYAPRIHDPNKGNPQWGIVERWRFQDRQDLGMFGGVFVPIAVAKHYAVYTGARILEIE